MHHLIFDGHKVVCCNMGPKYLRRRKRLLVNCAKIGFGKTMQDVLQIVNSTVLKKGTQKVDKISHVGGFIFARDDYK